jgi:hypothetical protein
MLYGLVHQRYILGRAGQQAMVRATFRLLFTSADTLRAGRQVRERNIWLLPTRLLRRLQRRPLRAL